MSDDGDINRAAEITAAFTDDEAIGGAQDAVHGRARNRLPNDEMGSAGKSLVGLLDVDGDRNHDRGTRGGGRADGVNGVGGGGSKAEVNESDFVVAAADPRGTGGRPVTQLG